MDNCIIATNPADVITPGNTCTYLNLFIELASTGQCVRVTAGGLNSWTLADGQYDFTTDDILPSSFGLPFFARGTKFIVRVHCQIPVGGRFCHNRYSNDSIDTGFFSDPAVSVVTNIGVSGAILHSGARTSLRGPAPMLLGKFVSGDPYTFAGCGDSIWDGANDSIDSLGIGYFARALCSTTPETSALGGINFGIVSGKNTMWVGNSSVTPAPRPEYLSHIKYVSAALVQYGTNDFDNGALVLNTSQLNGVWNLNLSLHNQLRLNALSGAGISPFKITQCHLMPRTATPTGPLPSDQTAYGVKWELGGNIVEYNARISAGVVAGTIDGEFDTKDLTRATPSDNTVVNYFRWVSGINNTSDGTHPSQSLHRALGLGLRAVLPVAV
jgi:hypothetical protein